MKVADAMTRGVEMVNASQTVRDAARIMAKEDVGFLPVEDEDRLVGTITDRDIVIRCVAEGLDCDAQISKVMTRGVKYCFADEEMDHVIANMGDIQVRRLPVMDRNKRLVGVVTLADAALVYGAEPVGSALGGVVTPGGMHSGSPESGSIA